MRRTLILSVCVVLCGALAADAYIIPVVVTAGNITVGCERIPSVSPGYDEVDFYLTGMTGQAVGPNNNGTQGRIDIISGRWTAGTGFFWVATTTNPTAPTVVIPYKTKTTNNQWNTPNFSCVNFDSVVSGATIWTNNAGGGGMGPQTSGNLYNYFSGMWYTSDFDADLVYGNGVTGPAGKNPNYTGAGTDSTYLARLYVTSATGDFGIGFGALPGSASNGNGGFGFTYDGETVENVVFYTAGIPEPGSIVLLLAGAACLLAWRRWRR